MWLEFMTKWLGGRAARRMGTGVLIVSMTMATGGASAKDIVCPPSIAPQPNVQTRVMALTDIQALPNRPDPRVEGSVIMTEGYLIRAISVRPTVSRCGTRVERSYRLRLLPKKPSPLKGRFSFRHAIVATVPARLVEGRMDANGALIALVGERVRLSGILTFVATSKEKLNKTQGSLWELVAVSDVAPCPEDACSTSGP